jgi:hypothetical protein
LEVKLLAKIGAFNFLRQAARDKKPAEFPVVLMRENSAPSWAVMFAIEDTERFVQAYLKNKERNGPRSEGTQAQ